MERPGLLALLSQTLPRLIDGLTPQGRMPTQGEMPQGGLGGMLRDILGHLGGERDADDGSSRQFGESPSPGEAQRPHGSAPVRNT
jgi:hypothetical protein